MSLSAPLLRLANVSKSFAGLNGASGLAILRNTNLEVAAGESAAIMGPSGSGKSTLLNIIGTLDQPDSGTVELEGENITRLDESALARLRNRQIGFVFQAHHLLPQCSVIENVLVPTLAEAKPNVSGDVADRAGVLLKRVGLGERLQHRPGQLSGGERQRVAVVRALINKPKLLLADEPTGALDRSSAQELARLLVELNREEHVTLIVVTHAAELARQMNRVFELREGALVQSVG